MTAQMQIPQALVAAYRSAGIFPDAMTAYPNAQFSPPAVSQAWATIWDMPAGNVEFTVNTADEYMGFMQIDLNYPRNTGTGATQLKIAEIQSVFPRHKRFKTPDGHIEITECSASGGGEINGWWRTPVTIRYRGFYRRN